MSQSDTVGPDVRFLSKKCWIWWPHETNTHIAECIDGETGFKIVSTTCSNDDSLTTPIYSEASTYSFTQSFIELSEKIDNQELNSDFIYSSRNLLTLNMLRRMKCIVSPTYEYAKNLLLHKNAVFRHWHRREKCRLSSQPCCKSKRK